MGGGPDLSGDAAAAGAKKWFGQLGNMLSTDVSDAVDKEQRDMQKIRGRGERDVERQSAFEKRKEEREKRMGNITSKWASNKSGEKKNQNGFTADVFNTVPWGPSTKKYSWETENSGFDFKKWIKILSLTLVVTAISMSLIFAATHPDNDYVTAAGDVIGSKFSSHEILSAHILPYPGYDGSLFPKGKVTVRFNSDDTFLMVLEANGLEENCQGCGIHIHEGGTCSNDTLVGPHYWNKAIFNEDPWKATPLPSVYDTVNSESLATVHMNTGLGYQDTIGKAVVLHAKDGSRIGCGLLHHPLQKGPVVLATFEASMKAYAGYDGPLKSISGTVQLDVYDDGVLKLQAYLEGVEENCRECGVHVHQGKSCDDPNLIGKHHWNEEQIPQDPWAHPGSAWYSSTESGTATKTFHIHNGYSVEGNRGHTVVVHAMDGTRIGCGVLKPLSM